MWKFALVVLVPPIALASWSRVRAAALVTTIVLTGATAFLASLVFLNDPSIGTHAAFFLAFGPAFAVPVATITAGSFARARMLRLLGVTFAALLGWALGIVAMFTPDAHAPTPIDPWWRLVMISGPSIDCSCGAILATVRKRT